MGSNSASPYFNDFNMPGILYLVPNTLGPADLAAVDILSAILPLQVQALAARLDYFVAENANYNYSRSRSAISVPCTVHEESRSALVYLEMKLPVPLSILKS